MEVAWTVKAFHGGGYSYRLCPAHDPLGLTEARAAPPAPRARHAHGPRHARRSVVITMARLTTERLFWHCGAHTLPSQKSA